MWSHGNLHERKKINTRSIWIKLTHAQKHTIKLSEKWKVIQNWKLGISYILKKSRKIKKKRTLNQVKLKLKINKLHNIVYLLMLSITKINIYYLSN